MFASSSASAGSHCVKPYAPPLLSRPSIECSCCGVIQLLAAGKSEKSLVCLVGRAAVWPRSSYCSCFSLDWMARSEPLRSPALGPFSTYVALVRKNV